MSGYQRPYTAKHRADQAEKRQTDVARNIRDISQQLYGETAGLRSGTTDVLNRVLAGERPEQFRIFAPEREAVESQFRNARESILASTPARGGQLNTLLANTDLARAGTLSQMDADIRRSAFDQALRTGYGVPALSLGGLGSAGGIFGQQVAGAEGGASGKNSSAGSLVGLAAALALL